MWFVYVLLCQDGSLYTGISPDPEKRLQQHLSGKGAKYTRSHKPVKIVYQEKFDSRSEALKREAEIKGWRREKKVRVLKLSLIK